VSGVARRALPRLARTRLGTRALASLARSDPWQLIAALGPPLRGNPRLGEIHDWPERLAGFEDLAFLFSSNRLNRGVASLDLDEAAYLYRLVRSLEPGTLVEIGRYRGGSTLLIAAAMHPESRLVSYDIHVKAGGEDVGAELDRELRAVLERYGLADRVELVVGDSRTAPGPDRCELVFVDGDHSYAGARADYERWRTVLPEGGHLLIHDALALHELAFPERDVVRLAQEIEREDGSGLRRAGGAGTLLHLTRGAT
jgi:predicted O-methyltransferase YrrM